MQTKSKTGLLIKNTLVFALGSFGSKLIQFFLVPIYTNYLSTEEYGTSDLVFTFAQIFIPVFSLVIFDAIIRYGLQYKKNPCNVLLNGVLVWALGSFLLLAFLPIISLYRPIAEWIWYLYFYVILNILLSILLNYIKIKENNIKYSLICIFQTLSLAGLNIFLIVYKSMGIKGYLISNILATLIAVVLVFFTNHIFKDLHKANFDIKLLKEMVLFSSPLIFNNLAWWVIQSSDKIMLEEMVSISALGLYTVASRIPSVINVVVSVFQQAWGISSIVEMDSSDDKSFYANVFHSFTTIVFFGCIIINSFIRPFMRIYVGADYFESWKLVPLLLLSAAFSAIAAYFGAIYGALKKSVNTMVTTLIAASINIIVNYVAIKLTGLYGAVIGTAVSYCALALLRKVDVDKYISIEIDNKVLLINFLIVAFHAISITFLDQTVIISIIAIILCVIVNRVNLYFIVKNISKFLWRKQS